MWCRAHSLVLSWKLDEMLGEAEMRGYAQAQWGGDDRVHLNDGACEKEPFGCVCAEHVRRVRASGLEVA